MPDERNDERERAYFQADFKSTQQLPNNEMRTANALDYIAYHMGQISKNLGQINARTANIEQALLQINAKMR